MSFIEQYDPDYVLILSGDHIYKMDYSKMLAAHTAAGADVTIAVRPVPWEIAPSFGIMSVDAENRITEFEEKPKHPKSNLASMGVYIFTWKVLREYLIADDKEPEFEKRLRQEHHSRICSMIISVMLGLPLRELLEGRRHDCKPLGSEHGSFEGAAGVRSERFSLEDLRAQPDHAAALHRFGRALSSNP